MLTWDLTQLYYIQIPWTHKTVHLKNQEEILPHTLFGHQSNHENTI